MHFWVSGADKFSTFFLFFYLKDSFSSNFHFCPCYDYSLKVC